MLHQIFPPQIEHNCRGHRIALWLFGNLSLLALTMIDRALLLWSQIDHQTQQ
jgi:hypothetical protein